MIGSCADCAFARPIQGTDSVFECHRYPPQPVRGSAPLLGHVTWPVLDAADFCGEWAAAAGAGGMHA